MKIIKQHNIHIFEIDLNFQEDEVLLNLERFAPIVQNHLCVLSNGEPSEKILNFLREQNICYIIRDNCPFELSKSKPISEAGISMKEVKVKEKPKNTRFREVVKKPVRSGTFIKTENDLAILSQVNDGAEIEASGVVELFGTLNGKVICTGEYMLVRDIGATGSIIFNGVMIKKSLFQTKKAKLIKLDRKKQLVIEEL